MVDHGWGGGGATASAGGAAAASATRPCLTLTLLLAAGDACGMPKRQLRGVVRCNGRRETERGSPEADGTAAAEMRDVVGRVVGGQVNERKENGWGAGSLWSVDLQTRFFFYF